MADKWGWGSHFRIKRQLDASELARYANYQDWCRNVWYSVEPGDYEGAPEEIWRSTISNIQTI